MTRIHRIVVAVAAVGLLSLTYVAGQRSAVGQTQAEMTDDAYHAFIKADARLNAVYKRLLNRYADPDSAVTRKKIIAAERAWIVYRDAEANMDASIEGEGGSVYPMQFYSSRAGLTNIRAKDMEETLKDLESR